MLRKEIDEKKLEKQGVSSNKKIFNELAIEFNMNYAESEIVCL